MLRAGVSTFEAHIYKFRQSLTGVQLGGAAAWCGEEDAALLCLEELSVLCWGPFSTLAAKPFLQHQS